MKERWYCTFEGFSGYAAYDTQPGLSFEVIRQEIETMLPDRKIKCLLRIVK